MSPNLRARKLLGTYHEFIFFKKYLLAKRIEQLQITDTLVQVKLKKLIYKKILNVCIHFNKYVAPYFFPKKHVEVCLIRIPRIFRI